MGSSMSKSIGNPCKGSLDRREKIRALEGEIKEVRCKRENESRAYVTQEIDWRVEKKKLKEEVRRLGKKLEARDEKLRKLEEEAATESEKDLQFLGAYFLVEHMREEQALREEAVEKWKRLYLAIKAELDDLIHRTRQGERLRCGATEAEIIEGMQRELMAKEETVEVLRERLAAMKTDGLKKEREIDILRQSLRIMSNSKSIHVQKNFSRSLHV